MNSIDDLLIRYCFDGQRTGCDGCPLDGIGKYCLAEGHKLAEDDPRILQIKEWGEKNPDPRDVEETPVDEEKEE